MDTSFRIINCKACSQKLRAPADKTGICTCPTCGLTTFIYGDCTYAQDNTYQQTYKAKQSATESSIKQDVSKSKNKWYAYRAAGFIFFIALLVYQSLERTSVYENYFDNNSNSFNQLISSPNIVGDFSLPPATSDMCNGIAFEQVLPVDDVIHMFEENVVKLHQNAFTKSRNKLKETHFEPYIWTLVTLSIMLVIGVLFWVYKISTKHKDLLIFYPALLIAIVSGSWGWSTHITESAPSHDLEYYNRVLLPAEKVFSLLSPWAYREIPYKQYNDEYVNKAIAYHLSKGSISIAKTFADGRINGTTEKAAQAAYYAYAIDAYKSNYIVNATRSIHRASKIKGQENYIGPTRSRIFNRYAMMQANQGDFRTSLIVKSQIEHKDAIDEYDAKNWMDLYQKEIHKKLTNVPFNLDTLGIVQGVIRNYLNSSSFAPPSIQRYFMCELSEVHLITAKEQLAAGNPDETIAHTNFSKKLVDSKEITNALYVSAMELKGIIAFEDGDIDDSVSYLSSALNNDVDNNILACKLALVSATKGQHLAFSGSFNQADKILQDAMKLCPNENIKEMFVDALLLKSQWLLRRGELKLARGLLLKIQESEYKSPAKLAKTLWQDSFNANARYRKLAETSKWATEIPRITGTICNINPETGYCEHIILYDGDREIGRAELDFSYVEIRDFNKTIYLKDTLRDGRFDSYELTDKYQSQRLYEKDGDYLLDREVVLTANGGVIKDEIYSGRLFLRFPNGAVKSGCDNISSCDPYLLVNQNGRFLGNTDVDNNTQFPTWDTGAVIDFKRGDYLEVVMMDYDVNVLNLFVDISNGLFDTDFDRDEDDIIDRFKFPKLPEQKIYTGEMQQAQLQLLVSPTNAPPGMYKWDNSDNVNIFRHYTSGSYEVGVMESIVQGAHKTEEFHEFTATAASWTLPEVALYAVFGHGKFIQQMLIGIAVSEVTHEALKNREE